MLKKRQYTNKDIIVTTVFNISGRLCILEIFIVSLFHSLIPAEYRWIGMIIFLVTMLGIAIPMFIFPKHLLIDIDNL